MKAPDVMTCQVCPRHCSADRETQLGFCRASHIPEVASICCHKGEEPPICGSKGICNLFFAHCNLQCVYCQNYDISRGSVAAERLFYHSLEEVVERICEVLQETENILGFVSPSHYAFAIPPILEALHARGLYPTVVYNTNGYDSVATLRALEPYIDIYLPDFKYMSSDLARRYSHAPDYPEVAQRALLEMFRQKGSSLPTDDNGLAYRGIILRHLVLPGQIDNSLRVLDWVADNISLKLHISLMAQYFPLPGVELPDALGRTITAEEFAQVEEHFYALGFLNGWVQELSSNSIFRPNFEQKNAFE